MKKLLYVVTLMFAMTSCYTLKSVSFQDEEYVKVYDDLPGMKDDLYLKSNEWMVSIFKDAKSVIQHSDKEEGVIIGKYLLRSVIVTSNLYGAATSADVYAVIDIRVKDNKARISVKPYDYSYNSMFPFTKEEAQQEIADLSDSFHQSLEKEEVSF